MNNKSKKILAVFMILLISTLLFYTTPLHTYAGNDIYGAIALGSVGSFVGFPGIIIGGALGYFLGDSNTVNAAFPIIAFAIVVGVGILLGGAGASGGTCGYYTAPETANCEICNSKLMPCSEYYCKSLGQSCQYLKEEKKCIEVESDDRSAPIIQRCFAKDLGTRADYSVESTNAGCKVTNEVPAFSTLAIKFDLDEVSSCKLFSSPGQNLESNGLVLDNGFFDKEHFLLFDIRNASLQTIQGCRDGTLCTGYIRCKDKANNAMAADYFVNFKLKEAPDIEKPIIVSTLVNNGASVASNVNEVDFFMHVDDKTGVGECRYNKNLDSNLEQMPEDQKFNCENQYDAFKAGYKCNTRLRGIEAGKDNKYYFRCRDSSPQRNTMDVGYEFIIKGTNPLEITSHTLPTGEILTPLQTLSVTTTDKSDCSYKLDNKEEQDFGITGATTNTQQLTLSIGSHNLNVVCTDEAGNQVTTSSAFNVNTPDLIIKEINPNNTSVYTNIVPFTVKTSGGVYQDGNSTCSYGSGFRFSKNILSTETVHETNISLTDGVHDVSITCSDGFKQAVVNTRLEVNGRAYPQLIRVYTSGGALIVNTDQPAVCGFSTKVKEFNLADSVKMDSSTNTQHQLQLGKEGVYYVKCEDTRTKKLSPSYTIVV
ncbi:hypothetical protein HY500_02100 [Candidatus Woesearchaeota archaeon]|nr:hypothetical protein [Candidatus Woesearchaeota archaeon]